MITDTAVFVQGHQQGNVVGRTLRVFGLGPGSEQRDGGNIRKNRVAQGVAGEFIEIFKRYLSDLDLIVSQFVPLRRIKARIRWHRGCRQVKNN
jgi:hypothetical protein